MSRSEMAPPLKVIYVLGTGFSGSTLLSLLLNAHPQIASVGELTGPLPTLPRPRDYLCSCGTPLGECLFWIRAFAAMAKRGVSFSPKDWNMRFDLAGRPLLNRVAFRSMGLGLLDDLRDRLVQTTRLGQHLRTIGLRNEHLIDVLLELTRKPVLADASKDPRRALLLQRTAHVDLRVVHLVKDVPRFVTSGLKNTQHSALALAAIWMRMSQQFQHVRRRIGPQRAIVVRYEDLCVQPLESLNRIAALHDLPPFEEVPDFSAVDHHVIGNRTRLRGGGAIRLDERWREALAPKQLRTLLTMTAPVRRKYGYPPAAHLLEGLRATSDS